MDTQVYISSFKRPVKKMFPNICMGFLRTMIHSKLPEWISRQTHFDKWPRFHFRMRLTEARMSRCMPLVHRSLQGFCRSIRINNLKVTIWLQAHLVTGVHEQSYLAHLAAYAGCLQKETLGCPTSGANEKVISLILTFFRFNDNKISWFYRLFLIIISAIHSFMSNDFPDKWGFTATPPSSADLVIFTATKVVQ